MEEPMSHLIARSTPNTLRNLKTLRPVTLAVAATAALCSLVFSPVQAQTAAPATADAAQKAALRQQIIERTKGAQSAQVYLDAAGGFRHAELDEPLMINMPEPAAYTPKISVNAAGGTRASLGASAMHFSIVHKHADGSLHSNCVEGDDHAHALKNGATKVEASNDR
jgi:hypothetical protein